MATGIQNSANSPATGVPATPQNSGAGQAAPTSSSNQGLQPTQQVPENRNLSVMEQNQQEMADAKTVSAKVYHGIPGSNFVAKDGSLYNFDYKGEMSIDNEVVQKQLDQIADKPGSPITLRQPKPVPAPGDEQPRNEILDRAAATAAAIRAQAAKQG